MDSSRLSSSSSTKKRKASTDQLLYRLKHGSSPLVDNQISILSSNTDDGNSILQRGNNKSEFSKQRNLGQPANTTSKANSRVIRGNNRGSLTPGNPHIEDLRGRNHGNVKKSRLSNNSNSSKSFGASNGIAEVGINIMSEEEQLRYIMKMSLQNQAKEERIKKMEQEKVQLAIRNSMKGSHINGVGDSTSKDTIPNVIDLENDKVSVPSVNTKNDHLLDDDDEAIKQLMKESLLSNINEQMDELKSQLIGLSTNRVTEQEYKRRLNFLNQVCDSYPNDMSKALVEHDSLSYEKRKSLISMLMQCLYLNNDGGRETFENDKALDNDGSNNNGEFAKAQMGTLWEDLAFEMLSCLSIENSDAATKLFCDIGSGYGQIVLQCSVEYNIQSIGLELVQNRHESAVFLEHQMEQLFKYMYLYKYKAKEERAMKKNSLGNSGSGGVDVNEDDVSTIIPRCIDHSNITNLKVCDTYTMFLNGSFGDENENFIKPNITPGAARINDILIEPKWKKIGKTVFNRFDSTKGSEQEVKCKLNVVELFEKVDYFFLNNAENTMEARNDKKGGKKKSIKIAGSKETVIEHIMELGYHMKVGAVLIAVSQISFKLNDWSSSKFHKDEYKCWMKEEKITLTGRLSWNKSAREHTFYKYTKIRNEWKCNYCNFTSPFVSDDGTLLTECLVKAYGAAIKDKNGRYKEYNHAPSETRKKTRRSSRRK
eukprot:g6047.t1